MYPLELMIAAAPVILLGLSQVIQATQGIWTTQTV